jgi:hypothetical protein
MTISRARLFTLLGKALIMLLAVAALDHWYTPAFLPDRAKIIVKLVNHEALIPKDFSINFRIVRHPGVVVDCDSAST